LFESDVDGGRNGCRLLSCGFDWTKPGIRAYRAVVIGLVLCMAASAAVAADAPPGAASCSGCHAAKPNVDTAVPRLAGQDPTAMVAALQAFRTGRRPATVMDRIAKGFSDDEIKAIAAWYGAQP
jgi:sulfide dehydrogenase cytochrome subunit